MAEATEECVAQVMKQCEETQQQVKELEQTQQQVKQLEQMSKRHHNGPIRDKIISNTIMQQYNNTTIQKYDQYNIVIS